MVVLNSDQIRALLPHRYPFLLLDRIIKLDPGKSATGIKNVTVNEPFFQGHFPTKSIMPGVLIVEALAQLTAVVYCTEFLGDKLDLKSIEEANIAEKVGYIAAIKNVKFKKIVVPGDQLVLIAHKIDSFGNLSNVNVSAFVNNELVVEGKLTVSQQG
ncbi:3-hydroxyacyl-ACP dehydratase FabZ [Clostridium felsineum]|uniref:3-hydroxyacyl-[acyl-carrier-protein] dehydratase FabZ n=1 Tax=Clostridium felsineum TaxID=36839 RepID=A0A1S8LQP0_9CLOT|nr:3-hydroxyacyl-ACP dehydratase FabZ [Clostridium felsineum]MCR3759394.1 3-hydroxyacyl-ACP dehydratase FabZ [Clostridium felsineum]URZ01695.1 3-hydroxyacyl-[acyl-carrier-protein] dehydratase FabZ [Clostridium felsineum]URZ05463.1 3-hydroxyacyl-[acyl-carrier-protein] dehydratase FabZ [Clostridium felsineum]URZ10503.1 3-hydroxyacyl-[acyl-carrier-protein] dehydratase FabZ [Clostridium felsineum]URZ17582.1 3-hydroxyacyl-[acyl-carrier-protein] dehydratase FabZ [Clostridium felsineum DSM 794]